MTHNKYSHHDSYESFVRVTTPEYVFIIKIKYYFKKLWKESRGDLFIWLISFFGVLIFGVVIGLMIGVISLIANLIRINFKSKLIPVNPFQNRYTHLYCPMSHRL